MELDASSVIRAVDLCGVLFNGAIGASLARQRRFDIVGYAILAITSGLAGGVLRDVMLQEGPPVALTSPVYLVLALAGALAAHLVQMDGRGWRWTFAVTDALALGCWAATGTAKALSAGLSWLPAILLGLVTAVGGGMVRDICVGKTPAVFGGNTLYATAAVAASTAMVLTPAPLRLTWGTLAGIAVGAGLCLVARWRRWQLPQEPRFGLQGRGHGLRRAVTWVETQLLASTPSRLRSWTPDESRRPDPPASRGAR